ncbi:MAG: thioesterase [Clostridia bacterium]|nr:thioesterase [Clostridia bacterium]
MIGHKVRTYECDMHDNMKADFIQKYMQEAATEQMTKEGLPYDELLERGVALLINRMDIDFIKPIKKFDQIEIKSWPCEGRGATLPRKYEVYRGGELVAKALGQWSLVETSTMKIMRANAVDFSMFTVEEGDIPSCERFKCPEDMQHVDTYEVRYNDCDINGHLNNTQYLRIAQDYIPELNQGKRIRQAKIHFSKEAPLGSVIEIYLKREDNTIYFKSHIGDMTNCEMKLVLG